jgi:hypothetical protein
VRDGLQISEDSCRTGSQPECGTYPEVAVPFCGALTMRKICKHLAVGWGSAAHRDVDPTRTTRTAPTGARIDVWRSFDKIRMPPKCLEHAAWIGRIPEPGRRSAMPA